MAVNKRNGESGFALLLVFLVAAVAAIMIYREIPRVAFQSQRHREQLLVERGEQFKRAIQVYRSAYPNQWPRDIKELEEGHNRHFLRHNYVDPMTGKAEWRLVHIQGNMLTDSVLNKKKQGQQGSGSDPSNYMSSTASIGESYTQTGSRPQDRRRASENQTGERTMGGPSLPGREVDPNDPNAPPAPDQQAGAPNPNQPGAPSAPGQAVPGQPGVGQPGEQTPSLPGQPGSNPQTAGIPGQPGSNPQMPGPVFPAVPNPQTPGQPATPMPSSAAALIGNLLTRPNPAGLAAIQGNNAGTAGSVFGSNSSFGNNNPPSNPGGPNGSGGPSGFSSSGLSPTGQSLSGSNPLSGGGQGIAGVASKAEMEGIMVYNDRTAYNEWEFIFDPAKTPRTPMNNIGPTFNPSPGKDTGSKPASMQIPQGMGGMQTGAQIRMGRP